MERAHCACVRLTWTQTWYQNKLLYQQFSFSPNILVNKRRLYTALFFMFLCMMCLPYHPLQSITYQHMMFSPTGIKYSIQHKLIYMLWCARVIDEDWRIPNCVEILWYDDGAWPFGRGTNEWMDAHTNSQVSFSHNLPHFTLSRSACPHKT